MILVVHPGSGSCFLPIPDPGVKQAPDLGSGSASLLKSLKIRALKRNWMLYKDDCKYFASFIMQSLNGKPATGDHGYKREHNYNYCIALLYNCRMFLYLYVLFAPYTHAAAGDHGDKGERWAGLQGAQPHHWRKEGQCQPRHPRGQAQGQPYRYFWHTNVADSDSGSGAFLTPGSEIRDGKKIKIRIRILDEHFGSYFRELRNNF